MKNHQGTSLSDIMKYKLEQAVSVANPKVEKIPKRTIKKEGACNKFNESNIHLRKA